MCNRKISICFPLFLQNHMVRPRRFYTRRNNKKSRFYRKRAHSYCSFVSLKMVKKIARTARFFMITKIYRHHFVHKYNFYFFNRFKDFHSNSPHPQSSRTGSLWLIKVYTDEDLSLVISSWNLCNKQW